MRASSPSQALAVTLVDELARGGLEHACASPGSRSAPLALALADDPRIDLHVLLDERSASFAALGIAKSTGAPVAIVCTSGTAAANLHPAVIEAHHSRTPLVVMTADRPPELRATGATQTIDQLKLFGEAVRWFVDVGVAEEGADSVRYWRSLAARAYLTAAGSPRGPVHLNIPFRDPLVPSPGARAVIDLPGRAEGAPWTTARRRGPSLRRDDLAELAHTISDTERGLVVAGACDVDPEPILALAEAAQWPVLAEATSGLRRGDCAVSTYDALLRHDGFARQHRPGAVLRVGAVGISRALIELLTPDVNQILIDPDGWVLDPSRAVGRVIQADPADACRALASRVKARSGSRWMQAWRGADSCARRVIEDVLATRVTEPAAARDVAACLPDGATLVVAASMPVRDLDWFMEPRAGLRVLANRGANGIDGFVSTTLGVALASDGPVAALCGDLSMLHDQNGLMLGRTEPIDVTFVVINNNGGGVFSFLPQSRWPRFFESLFATPQNVDFADLCRLHRASHEQVTTRAGLREAVAGGLAEPGVHVVEVRTDRDENARLHRRVWSMLSAELDRRQRHGG